MRSVTIKFRVTPLELALLDDLAAADGRDRSSFLRHRAGLANARPGQATIQPDQETPPAVHVDDTDAARAAADPEYRAWLQRR